MKKYNVHVVPLTVTLAGKSYREGIDIQPDAFYQLLDETGTLPVTSQPAAGNSQALQRTGKNRPRDPVHPHFIRAERHFGFSARGRGRGARG